MDYANLAYFEGFYSGTVIVHILCREYNET